MSRIKKLLQANKATTENKLFSLYPSDIERLEALSKKLGSSRSATVRLGLALLEAELLKEEAAKPYKQG